MRRRKRGVIDRKIPEIVLGPDDIFKACVAYLAEQGITETGDRVATSFNKKTRAVEIVFQEPNRADP